MLLHTSYIYFHAPGLILQKIEQAILVALSYSGGGLGCQLLTVYLGDMLPSTSRFDANLVTSRKTQESGPESSPSRTWWRKVLDCLQCVRQGCVDPPGAYS